MEKYTGIIIVSDIDGTFRSHTSEMGTKRNIEAVEKFKAEGGLFTFATGRDFNSLKSVVPDVESIVNAPVIVSNGARLYDISENRYIIDACLNMQMFSIFLKQLYAEYPEIGVRFTCDEGILIPVMNDMIKNDLNSDKDNALFDRAKEISLDDIACMHVPKCVIVHNPDVLYDVQKLGEEFDTAHDFYFSKSYARGLEAVNRKYTKGRTAVRLKEYLNVPDGVLYAAGNYDNDVDMLLSADIAVCPNDAADCIKDVADITTVSCDDGSIADLIARL